jgi:hypothetical protein
MDLNSILQTINNFNSTIGQSRQALTEQSGALNEINQGRIAATVKQGDNSALIKEQELLQKQQAEANASAIVEALGGNPSSTGNLIIPAASNYAQARVEAQKSLDKITELENASLLENPLGYIMAQFQLSSEVKKYNSLVDKMDFEKSGVQEISAMANNAAISQKAVQKTVNDATIKAEVENTKLAATLVANALEADAIKNNMQAVVTALELDSKSLDSLVRAKSLINQEQEVALRQEQAAQSRREANLRMRELEDKKAEDEEFLNTVNRGLAALGKQPVNFATVKNMAKLAKGQEDISTWFEIGSSSLNNRVQLASAPLDSLNVIAKYSAQVPAPEKQVVGFVSSVGEQVRKGLEAKGYDQKTLAKEVNKKIVSSAESQLKNVDPTASNNIYAPPSLNTVGQSKAVQESKLWREALAPIADTKDAVPFNNDVIVSTAIAAFKKGKISYNELNEGLGTIYNAAKEINNASKNYTKYALPEMSSFNTEMPLINTFNFNTTKSLGALAYSGAGFVEQDLPQFTGKQLVNMSDSKSRELYLNKYLAATKSQGDVFKNKFIYSNPN